MTTPHCVRFMLEQREDVGLRPPGPQIICSGTDDRNRIIISRFTTRLGKSTAEWFRSSLLPGSLRTLDSSRYHQCLGMADGCGQFVLGKPFDQRSRGITSGGLGNQEAVFGSLAGTKHRD